MFTVLSILLLYHCQKVILVPLQDMRKGIQSQPCKGKLFINSLGLNHMSKRETNVHHA